MTITEGKDFGDRFKTVATEDSYDIFRGASYALKWGQQCGRTNTAAMRAMKVLGATCNAFYLPFLIGDYNALRHKTCELFTGKDPVNKRVAKFGLSLSDATCDTCGFVEALHFHKILSFKYFL